MDHNEFEWQRRHGRDPEGNQFDSWVLVHGTGRILARIANPLADEYYWRAYFYIPKSVMEFADEGHDFISQDSAMEFVETCAGRWPADIMERITARAALKPVSTLQPQEA